MSSGPSIFCLITRTAGGLYGGGDVYFRPVGMHLQLPLCLSKQATLLSLSGNFLLLGKTEMWAFGSQVNQCIEGLLNFTLQAMNYFGTCMQLQYYLLCPVKVCDSPILIQSTSIARRYLRCVCVHHIKFNESISDVQT